MRIFLVFTLVTASLAAATAAELPTRAKGEAALAMKACKINGKPGFLGADGQTCMAISGYVSGQASYLPAR